MDAIEKRFDRLEETIEKMDKKLDQHTEMIWKHINTDTKNFERLDAKIQVIESDAKWIKRIGTGLASILIAVITWFLERIRHV